MKHQAISTITKRTILMTDSKNKLNKALSKVRIANDTLNNYSHIVVPSNSLNKILTRNTAFTKEIARIQRATASHQGITDALNKSAKLRESFLGNSAFTSAINHAKKIQEQLGMQASAFAGLGFEYNKHLEHIVNTNTRIQETIEALGASAAFTETMARLAFPENLAQIAATAANLTVESNFLDTVADWSIDDASAVNDSITELSETNDNSEFLNVFLKLPASLQATLLYLYHKYILPIILGLAVAVIYTTQISEIIEQSTSDIDKVRKIRKLSYQNNELMNSNVRFVTKNNVNLRAGPGKKYEIVDELYFGRTIIVESKERNWIEVTINYDNDKSVTGWIFTRYTSRFNSK